LKPGTSTVSGRAYGYDSIARKTSSSSRFEVRNEFRRDAGRPGGQANSILTRFAFAGWEAFGNFASRNAQAAFTSFCCFLRLLMGVWPGGHRKAAARNY